MRKTAFLAVAAAVGVGLYWFPPAVLQAVLHDYLCICLLAYVALVLVVSFLLPGQEVERVDPSGKAVLITGKCI